MTPREDDDSSEEGVTEDDHVASSRAGKDSGDDGTYVGQTSSDDAIDAEESGAEARSNDGA
ncbi:hypothetical protein H7I77_01655 [Mycolicibacterium novocastrense]|uniref:Uncharacterized protein n=1 Tax=Mycolicibacterium novocastrense TaxID=59813 RepID=A0AAW5SFF4_MYCNV|nr:hypothetical protein [Mycolicibacterium novocastrense]MCV7022056.1 hypothetical protein [Mycolicibacterium novocastrense]GAT11824.1 hypothetical protein RMCN_4957 [Mycolicibacterium novocastrense]